jgi:hypothetical protein
MEPMMDTPFTCENCDGSDFVEGPHGGWTINFACHHCWARYNDLGPLGIDRHGFVKPWERDAFHGSYTPRANHIRQREGS